MPDANNILQLSKLFGVTTDYLLNDDYEGKLEASAPEAATEAPAADAPAPTVRKKRYLHWLLIPALCIVISALSVLVTLKIVNDRTPPMPEVHHHSEFVRVIENEVAPSCAAEGSYDEVIYCGTCDEELLRATQSLAKLAHTLTGSVKEDEVAPTCTAGGSYTEVVYCIKCDEAVVRSYRSTERLIHRYQNGKCVACNEDQPSEGLFYMSNGDGTCFVDGGDCDDEHIVIPSYSPSGDIVKQIKEGAFAYNHTVISVQIPETVTDIGDGAFRGCTNLESVNLPSRLTRIPSYMFQGCKKLKDVIIPANVYKIGAEAFAECSACERIVIPAAVETIGKFAFRNFAGGDGTVIFEVYDGWRVYDESGYCVAIIDFQSGIATPTDEITYRFADLVWKRHS